MKPKETAPLIPVLATAALAAPSILIGAAIGLALLWFFSNKENAAKKNVSQPEAPPPQVEPLEILAEQNPFVGMENDTPEISESPRAVTSRITREDLADALAYGERRFRRKQAVDALQAQGFRKTAAYKALAPTSKFGGLLAFTTDGLIEWKG